MTETLITRALVVVEPPYEHILEPIRRGAEQAGWQPMPFDNPEFALEEFDITIKAVITQIGINGAIPRRVSGRFPQSGIYDRAYRQNTPLAILSTDRYAKRYLRKDSFDIMIDPADDQLLDNTSKWLTIIKNRRLMLGALS